MKQSKNLAALSEGSIPKTLLKLGIPTMVGMMVSSLYNLVDAYFVGGLGTTQQAAVSVVYPISLVMLGIGLLFGSGSGSYLSRLLGSGRHREADECASTILFTSVVTAILLVGFMMLFLNPLLMLLGCTKTMLPYARQYAVPFILGLVVNVFNVTMSNIATSEGASLYSMRSMLVGGIINVILDPLFIIGLKMGVLGAALATLAARIISCATYICYILGEKGDLHFSARYIRIRKDIYLETAKIGIPSMIYQFLCSAALSLTNVVAAAYGDAAIAALGIVNRITSLCLMTVMGFLKGYQPFVGFNHGAGKHARVKEATRIELIWTTGFALLACVAMVAMRVPVIRAFNQYDAEVLRIGVKALAVNGITFATMGIQLVYSTKFMGLGRAKEGGLISLGRQGLFFIPVIFVFSALWGLDGVIYAQPAADILSLILVGLLGYKNYQEEKRMIFRERGKKYADCVS